VDDALQTSDSYATYIFNEWRDILLLSERVRTNFFYFIDKENELEEYAPSNEEKEELYAYVSKMVGLYSALYSKVTEREDFGKFRDEFEVFAKFHDSPWLLLQEGGSAQGFETLTKLERTIGKALEKLKLLTFEKVY
jgi:hypothetical protein